MKWPKTKEYLEPPKTRRGITPALFGGSTISAEHHGFEPNPPITHKRINFYCIMTPTFLWLSVTASGSNAVIWAWHLLVWGLEKDKQTKVKTGSSDE